MALDNSGTNKAWANNLRTLLSEEHSYDEKLSGHYAILKSSGKKK